MKQSKYERKRCQQLRGNFSEQSPFTTHPLKSAPKLDGLTGNPQNPVQVDSPLWRAQNLDSNWLWKRLHRMYVGSWTMSLNRSEDIEI